MNLYTEKGYLNINYIMTNKQPFIFIVGGRGTGKTYGFLKYVLDNKIKFLYMRRTQAQADIINKPEFSPFKALQKEGYNIVSSPLTKYNSGFYKGVYNEESEKTIIIGDVLGYSIALSTVSNLRGFDMSDVKLLIYDEFIGEKHERPLKNEASALFNCYETINRNRELEGEEPLTLACLANANNLSNPVFTELNLVNKAVSMSATKKEVSIMNNRGIALYMLSKSPVSEKKAKTALYNLTKGNEFFHMSIDNSFNSDNTMLASVNIKEYKPIFTVEGLTVYTHKTNNQYYITSFKSGACREVTKEYYKSNYYRPLFIAYMNGKLKCDTMQTFSDFSTLST